MNRQTNQQELPLLSVIVFAYNIEKELLNRCVSSAVRQTYTNLEIILVNNASTDDTTGLYCDEWEQKDNRIKVIHFKAPVDIDTPVMKATTGEYIHILDHDDWIAPNMYAKMMSAMLSTNSDIARCEFCFAYPDGRIEHRNITHETVDFETVGREESVLLLLENKKWQTYWWQNIFKKSLFDHYVSPTKEEIFGDLATIHTLFNHALQTVYLHDVFYYYYQRPGSEVNSLNDQRKMYRDYCRGNAHYERYLFVKQHTEYHGMLRPLKKTAALHGIFSLWDMIDNPQCFPDNAYKEQVEKLNTFSLSLRVGAMLFILNLDLLILKIFPNGYKPYYKLFRLFYKNLRRLYRYIKRKHN